MRELLNDIERWQQAGKQIAIARVVDIEGSGPRDPGAAMAVNEDGEVVGSVSGGCVEGAVVAEALEILRGDQQPRLVKFGYSDDEAFAVGLTCGGIIHLFISPLTWQIMSLQPMSLYPIFAERVRSNVPVALVTVIDGPHISVQRCSYRHRQTQWARLVMANSTVSLLATH